MDQRIFVQVAAYRDPELLPTLHDCIARADRPDQLVFGICWQHDGGESLGALAGKVPMRVVDVHFSESRGACWARQQTQQLYDGEPYTLQIDSHHRFAPGWDTSLRRLFAVACRQGGGTPLLTGYAPPYDPDDDPAARGQRPLRLVFDEFTDGGPFRVRPIEIPATRRHVALERARFLSAHFLFTLGRFCTEVPYDPRMYFFGEEPSLAIRAYTHGYDLYHPREVLLWHFYGRSRQARHWTDNRMWWLRNERSLLRYRRLVGIGGESQDLSEHGLGSARSLADYERYAGLSLADRRVSLRTLRAAPPSRRPSRWRTDPLLTEHLVTVRIDDAARRATLQGAEQLVLTARCAKGHELGQRVLEGETLEAFLADGHYRFPVYAMAPPHRWSATPWSSSGGWAEAIMG